MKTFYAWINNDIDNPVAIAAALAALTMLLLAYTEA